MADLEPLLAFWRGQDALFERALPTWWGAVISDARFPAIQEPNYARVETRQPVRLAEIEAELLPALALGGSSRAHVVIFHAEDQVDLIAEASTRGERITWDLVMSHDGVPRAPDGRVEEVFTFDDAFWAAHRASTRLFDLTEDPVLDQLQAIEREVLIPAGRRWFVVHEGGEPVSFAALLVLEGSGYIDHVVTLTAARRRGHAGSLTRRVVAEAAAAGAERTFLLAEPGSPAARIYERAGFERLAHIASWLSPLPPG